MWGIHRGPVASYAENVSIWWRHHVESVSTFQLLGDTNNVGVFPKVQCISWRRYGMETLSALLALCEGNTLVHCPFGVYSMSLKCVPDYVVFYCGLAALLVLMSWCESFTHTLQGYFNRHYSDVIMSAMASHFSEASIVFSTVCAGTDQRKNITRLTVSALCKGIYWTGDQWIPRTNGQ